jgi:hypothetical protein
VRKEGNPMSEERRRSHERGKKEISWARNEGEISWARKEGHDCDYDKRNISVVISDTNIL